MARYLNIIDHASRNQAAAAEAAIVAAVPSGRGDGTDLQRGVRGPRGHPAGKSSAEDLLGLSRQWRPCRSDAVEHPLRVDVAAGSAAGSLTSAAPALQERHRSRRVIGATKVWPSLGGPDRPARASSSA